MIPTISKIAVSLAKRILSLQLRQRLRPKLYRYFTLLRESRPMTALLGLTHPCSPGNIEIILTFKCDLRCNDCSIICEQAPSEEQMTLEQITRFIQESVAQKRYWKLIRIIGGEPTLHPQIIEVLQLLANYKREFSPQTRVHSAPMVILRASRMF